MKDKIVESLIQEELERQQNTIELIASENIVSKAVLKAPFPSHLLILHLLF